MIKDWLAAVNWESYEDVEAYVRSLNSEHSFIIFHNGSLFSYARARRIVVVTGLGHIVWGVVEGRKDAGEQGNDVRDYIEG